MFSEQTCTDYSKFLPLSAFRFFDYEFKMVEVFFWAIILSTLRLHFTSKISCWFNTYTNFDLLWSYLSTSCLGDLSYRYGTQIFVSINKRDSTWHQLSCAHLYW